LADFFATRTRIDADTAESTVPFIKVYGAYREWATSMGISDREKMTAKALGSVLSSRFDKAIVNNARCYKGLELVTNSLPYDTD